MLCDLSFARFIAVSVPVIDASKDAHLSTAFLEKVMDANISSETRAERASERIAKPPTSILNEKTALHRW
jgi:hypothetical protein